MANELFLILHNIRSAYNVGAILRTAEGAGVARVYFSGYTPTPAEKNKIFISLAQKMIAKTALGAQEIVAWEKVESIEKLLEDLKKKKIKIIALEKVAGATDLKDFKARFPMALFLGNEVEGVPREILDNSDEIISIPMRGKKESLNVSVAAGIAIYEILK